MRQTGPECRFPEQRAAAFGADTGIGADADGPALTAGAAMSRSILLIEDQADIAGLVKLHLQDLSCNVDIAADGISGLAAARSRRYDLVILDLMLPGMDGLEVCRQMRASRIETPVMMLTAKAAEFD